MELRLELNAVEDAALPEGTPAKRRPRALTLPGSTQSTPRPQLSQKPAARNKAGKQSPRSLQRWTSEIGQGARITAASQSPAPLRDHGDAPYAAPGHRAAPSTGPLSPGWVEMYQLRSSLDKRIARLKVVDADGTTGTPEPHARPSLPTERGATLPAAAGRSFAARHAPLPAEFYTELVAAVHGVDPAQAQHFLSANRYTFVQMTVVDVINLQCADDTDGSQVRALMERLQAARRYFSSNRALLEAVESTVTHTASEKFQEIEEVLIVHTNVVEQLAEFERRSAVHSKLAGGKLTFVTPREANSSPWDRLATPVATLSANTMRFATQWCRRLQALSTDYYRRTSLRHSLVLPSLSTRLVSAIMNLVRLTRTLLYNDQLRLGNAGGDHISERKLDELVTLVKEVLSLNTSADADEWRAHLTKDQVVEYRRDLETVYKEYFVLLRSVGWHLRPELRIAAWIAESPGPRIAKRVDCLRREWRFVVQLLPKIRRLLPDASRHLVMGMMELCQLLLKDDSIFTSIGQKHADRFKTVTSVFSEVATRSVRSCNRLLLGDLDFARQVCESLVFTVAQYESVNNMDLLTQFRRCGYRALRLTQEVSVADSVEIMGAEGMMSFPIPKLVHWHEAEAEPEPEPAPAVARASSETEMQPGLTSRQQAFTTCDDPRVVMVPPRIADEDVDAFVQQLYDDQAQGFVVVLPGELGRHAWQNLEQIPSEMLSAHSQQIIREVDLRPGCMCLVAGSARQLLRSRRHFDTDMKQDMMEFGAVRAVAYAEAAFPEAKAVQESLNGLTLQIARGLLDHTARVEYRTQADEEKTWMVTLSYLKALSAFNPTRTETDSARLSRVCRTATERFDAFEKRKQQGYVSRPLTDVLLRSSSSQIPSAMQGPRNHRATTTDGNITAGSLSRASASIDGSVTATAAAGGEVDTATTGVDSASPPHRPPAGLQRSSGSIDTSIVLGGGMPMYRTSTTNSVDPDDTASAGSGSSSPAVDRDPRRARRRTSLDSLLGGSMLVATDAFLKGLGAVDSRRILLEEEEEDSPSPRQPASEKFDATRSELAMAQAMASGQQLLNAVQNAVAEGKGDLAMKLAEDYTAANTGGYVDPLIVREAKQLILREIGQPFAHRATNSLQKPAVSFSDRYLKDGRVTILYTSSTYTDEIDLQNCELVRVKLAMLGHVRVEYDLSLSNHAPVVQALKLYLAKPVRFPMVFFGTEFVGGWAEVREISEEDLVSFKQRYEEETQTWLEMNWDEIHIFGNPLGTGWSAVLNR